MNIELKITTTEKIPCTIDIPKTNIDEDRFNIFIDTLTKSDFLVKITEKTSLKWLEPTLNIKYSNEAEFEKLDTVLVDYNRGARAVSSATHEAFHLMLRQVKWTEVPVVKEMVKKYPELVNSSSHGTAYKMEQMFAYLLQNEIYQEIAQDLEFDASKDFWSMHYIIESFIPYEFDTPFLKQLALAVIQVWYLPNRSNDIFELVMEVEKILKV
ncbi:MAG: hypothetical protein AB9915_03930 [Candidatus Dojkabacteria bacterium]